MAQFRAKPALMASSTAWRLNTGNAPGKPRQTGHTFVLGGAPKLVGQPQKILVLVASCTWTSRPMTTSYLAIGSGEAKAKAKDMFPFIMTVHKGDVVTEGQRRGFSEALLPGF